MTDDEARELLEIELAKHLGPDDHVRVTVEVFRNYLSTDDYEPVEPVDEFMADPSTLRTMLVIRIWRYIDGKKFMSRQAATPEFVSDSLGLPGIANYLTQSWVRMRDEAILAGPQA